MALDANGAFTFPVELPAGTPFKGYLMNSAAYMTGAGAGDTLPSNSQGMGRMDLGRAFDATPRLLVDQTEILQTTGQTFTLSGSVVSADQPFRVTLAWSDAPGTTVGSPWVNDLDLEVTVGGVTYLGNVFSGAESAPGGTADIKNNVESVFLPAGTTGDFTITVRATNLAGDGVPGNDDATDQDFALIVYNASDGAPAIPRVGPSPAAVSFSGIAGGAIPDSQILSIHNTGTGALDFSASADAPLAHALLRIGDYARVADRLGEQRRPAPRPVRRHRRGERARGRRRGGERASHFHPALAACGARRGRRLRGRRRRVGVLGERAAIDRGLPARRHGLRHARAGRQRRRRRLPGHHRPR